MTQFRLLDERAQVMLASEPYDRWVSPGGACLAEFHRCDDGILMRFPDEADFLIDPVADIVEGAPAPGVEKDHVAKLLANSILPALGNHRGGLFLHGSAVDFEGHAIAFLGLSRSGKTTLAGAFAKNGHPFLTEDAIDLYPHGDELWIRPNSSALRLFQDSAEHLLGREIEFGYDEGKRAFDGGETLPFSDRSVPIAAIFVLGTNHDAPIAIERLSPGAALPKLLPHAFVLDVEDRKRMRAHFGRLADLAERVPVHTLDYQRDYSALPEVCNAIINACS